MMASYYNENDFQPSWHHTTTSRTNYQTEGFHGIISFETESRI